MFLDVLKKQCFLVYEICLSTLCACIYCGCQSLLPYSQSKYTQVYSYINATEKMECGWSGGRERASRRSCVLANERSVIITF